jgi:alkylmercury lyase
MPGTRHIKGKKGRKPMQHQSLESIAAQLAEQLRCEQQDLCLPILHQVTRGKPLEKAVLAASLQLSQEDLEQRLGHLPDTEFDQQSNIVGWGVTLVPTRHRFHIRGQSLIIPAERRDCVRASFCERSLFFWSEQAASTFLTAHPEAVLLSIEEAAYIGKRVAQTRSKGATRTGG